MPKSPRILVLGYNAWDVNLPVDAFPQQDTKCEVGDILMGGGGPGATAAVALSRLGAQVRFVTQFGDDLASASQQAELKAARVDLTLSRIAAGYDSPKAVILVHPKTGERTIFWSRGDLPPLAVAEMNPDWIQDTDLFYTDGHDADAALVLAREARLCSVPVVMDAGSVREGSAALIRQVTDAISSAGFAPALTGCDNPSDALRALHRRGPQQVAMTFGARGVLALVADKVHHVAAFDVPVVDTTGAGDAFHAGYAFGRACGREFLASLEYGSAVAALKCGRRGGRSGLPTEAEVAQLLKSGTRRVIPTDFIPILH
ncbi:MAG: PfkB family carbohydrate kinase [Candidatus Krumholzibacteria bacterium]|nr:PfkB family carbohydrate kinase [Candidatus Krumholzibacteria bacterium]